MAKSVVAEAQRMIDETAKAPLPASVEVGWRTYRIEEWNHRDAQGADKYGECNSVSNVIRIDTMHGKRRSAAVLLHEIMHACCTVWGLGKDDGEERIVTMFENGLATVWRDNPAVMAWIGYHLEHGD